MTTTKTLICIFAYHLNCSLGSKTLLCGDVATVVDHHQQVPQLYTSNSESLDHLNQ